jgi:hypothetical protein
MLQFVVTVKVIIFSISNLYNALSTGDLGHDMHPNVESSTG